MSVRRILLILFCWRFSALRARCWSVPCPRCCRPSARCGCRPSCPRIRLRRTRKSGSSGRLDIRELVKTLDYTYLRETDEHGFPNVGEWPSRADVVILGDSLVMGEGTGVEAGFVQRFARAVSAADGESRRCRRRPGSAASDLSEIRPAASTPDWSCRFCSWQRT